MNVSLFGAIMKLSVEEIKIKCKEDKFASIKYVRIGNDFRYAVAGGYTEHWELVEKGEIPTSAGFFSLFHDNELHLHETPSTSLKLGPLKEDSDFLKTIFEAQ